MIKGRLRRADRKQIRISSINCYALPISIMETNFIEVIMVDGLVVFTKRIEVKNPGAKVPSAEELSGALEWKLDDRFSYRFTDLNESTLAIAIHGKGFAGELLAKNSYMYGVLEFDRSSKSVRVRGILVRKQMVSLLLIMLLMIALPFASVFSRETLVLPLFVWFFVTGYFLNSYWVESRRYSKIAEVAAQQWGRQNSL